MKKGTRKSNFVAKFCSWHYIIQKGHKFCYQQKSGRWKEITIEQAKKVIAAVNHKVDYGMCKDCACKLTLQNNPWGN